MRIESSKAQPTRLRDASWLNTVPILKPKDKMTNLQVWLSAHTRRMLIMQMKVDIKQISLPKTYKKIRKKKKRGKSALHINSIKVHYVYPHFDRYITCNITF